MIHLFDQVELNKHLQWVRLASDPAGYKLIFEVQRAYSEPWRFYHTVQHLREMLEAYLWVEREGHFKWSEDGTVLWAILFHDYIYVPGHPDNELMSAAEVRKLLSPVVGEPVDMDPRPPCAKVERCILDTRDHWNASSGDEELDLFLDCDLVGFGSSPKRSDQINDQLHRELGYLPNYHENRREFLQGILRKEHIYRTKAFRDAFEERARENIRRELPKVGG